jgi:F-type H+-transporting ATPase subunit delta
MTSRTAATRYARALFDVALKEKGNLDEIELQLAVFVDLFKQHPLLEKVLLNPAVPVPRKSAAVSELLKHIKVSPVVGKLLILLAERDRLMLLPDLLEAFRLRLMDHQHVVRAEVTTATALSAERTGTIEKELAKATGRRVLLSTLVDPAIIGGLVTRIGGTIYDGSLTGQLARMKEKLQQA